MPYTSSAAQPGLGTVIAINTGTITTPVWTPIGEVSSSKQSGRKARTADVTNLQSLAAEFITTLVESGTFTLSGNRIAGDVGQVAIETAFSALKVTQFQASLPKAGAQATSGDAYKFLGVIEEWSMLADISPDKQITYSAAIKVSNVYTYTPGA